MLCGDKNISRKIIVANLVSNAVATGIVTFPDGRRIVLDAKDWASLVRFTFDRIDGPPAPREDVADTGHDFTIIVNPPRGEE